MEEYGCEFADYLKVFLTVFLGEKVFQALSDAELKPHHNTQEGTA